MSTARPERTRLERLIFESCLTHDEMAARAGISRQTLSHAVNGRPISLEMWVRLASGLGVTVAEIAPRDIAKRIVAVA